MAYRKNGMRTLYLISYDISDPKRLRKVCRYLKGYKVDGQKSVYECWVTESERRAIKRDLQELILPDQDRVHLFQLDPRQQVQCFGRATHFTEPGFFVT